MSEPIGEFLLFEAEDGKTCIESRFADEAVWLSQAMMAELFQTTQQNTALHLKALLTSSFRGPAGANYLGCVTH